MPWGRRPESPGFARCGRPFPRSPEVLAVEDLPAPDPGPGQVRLTTELTSVTVADVDRLLESRDACRRGSAVLTPVLQRCDRDGTAAALETSSEDNVRLCERLGFVVTAEVDPPGGAPHAWVMRRAPRP